MTNKQLLDGFLFSIKDDFEKISKEDLLNILRKKAFEIFNQKEISSNSFLNKFFSNSFNYSVQSDQEKILSINSDNSIVFLNGEYVHKLSNIKNNSLEILDLNEAMEKYPLFLQEYFIKSIEGEQDMFCLLNTAFLNGVYINIKEDSNLIEPIKIINIVTQDSKHQSSRIFINLSKNAKAKIRLTQSEKNIETTWVNQLVDIHLEEGSNLFFMKDTKDCKKNIYFDSLRSKVNKNADLKVVNLSKNTKHLRQDYQADLIDENAKANLYFLSNLTSENNITSNIKANHLSGSTVSKQIYKTVLNNKSTFDLKSDVYMKSIAGLSDSYQMNKNIILDDLSEVITKPNLEIFTDDVKATHGATTSNIDGEELFFLKTRGLNNSQAQKVLITAHLKEILEQIEIDEIKEEIFKSYLEE